MLTVNCTVIFNESADRILMCKRIKDPYKDYIISLVEKLKKMKII